MLATARRLTDRPFLRFLLGGALNTAITYAVFLGLSLVVHYSIAYTITYLVGICLAYVFAATFVFGSGFALSSALRFPPVYAIQYLYGLTALWLLIDVLGSSRAVAMLIVIATSIPLTFLLTRQAMKSNRSVGHSARDPQAH